MLPAERLCARWLVILGLVVFSRHAHAGELARAAAGPVRVAVVHSAEDEPARRLRAESTAVGLAVVDVRALPGDSRGALAIARETRVSAVLWLRPGQIELLIVDAKSDEPLYHEILMATSQPPELISVRAVEVLRARLVKLQIVPSEEPLEASPGGGERGASGEPGRSGEPGERRTGGESTPPPGGASERPTTSVVDTARAAPPADVPSRLPPRSPVPRDEQVALGAPRPRLLVGAALGGEMGGGGLGPGAAGGAAIHFEPTTRWGGSVLGLIPAAERTITDTRGSADVGVVLVGALLHYAVVGTDAPVAVEIGAGGGAAIAHMSGHAADSALVGRTETVVAAALIADASLLLHVTGWLRLRAEVLLALAVPRPTVQFDGQTVASWGRPFEGALVGAEIDVLGLGGGS